MYPRHLPYADWVHCQCRDFFTETPYDFVYTVSFDDYSIGIHEHSFYEINIVTNGTGVHYYGERIIPVQRGHVFVVPPGVYHGYYQQKGLSVLHILLHPQFTAIYQGQFREMPGLISLISLEPTLRASGTANEMYLCLDDKRLAQILVWTEELTRVLQSEYSGHFTQANGLMLFLLGMLGQWYSALEAGDLRINQQHSRAVIRSVEQIQTEYGSRLNISQLAKRCSMSRTCYIQEFQKLFRCAPGAYIISFRVLQAKELLISTDLSVGEIALRCGFYDNSHLVRFFTRQVGVSPKDYRAARRASQG